MSGRNFKPADTLSGRYVEVDGSEEEEEQDGEYYFNDRPSEDEGECVRKKSCEESDSEDECIGDVESD